MRVRELTLAAVLLLVSLLSDAGWGEEVKLLENRAFQTELASRVRGARTSIHMIYFLFKITDSPGNLPRRLAMDLIDAARRGVQVTVVLEDGGEEESVRRENAKTARLLSRGGVNVRFDSPRRTTHVKAAVIDNRHVFVGSHNLTHSALSRNNELTLYVDSPRLASRILSYSAERID